MQRSETKGEELYFEVEPQLFDIILEKQYRTQQAEYQKLMTEFGKSRK
jgi:hypothetical protein